MSKVIVERDDMVAIADSIRAKAGTTDEMTCAEMITAIGDIPGNAGQYGWEKYEEGGIQTVGNTSAYVKSLNMNYLSYTELGLVLYKTIEYADMQVVLSDSYTISADGSKTYYYVGDTVFTAGQIPVGYYIQVGTNVYRTTSSTTYVYASEEYNGLWYHLKLQNVEQVIASYSLIQHVFSDTADAYPDNGTADDGFYYRKVLPLSLETDLIPANIKKDVNILGVTGTLEAASSGETVQIKFSSKTNLQAFFCQQSGAVKKPTVSAGGIYFVDKGTMFVLVLRGSGSAPTVSGASHQQSYSATMYNSSGSTTYYLRVYVYLADANKTISC